MTICMTTHGAALRRPDAYTTVHIRFDGESNVFHDLCGNTITHSSTATQTLPSKFVGKSGKFGTDASRIYLPYSLLNFGSNNFTIEFFIKRITYNDGWRSLMGNSNEMSINSSSSFAIRFGNNNIVGYITGSDGVSWSGDGNAVFAVISDTNWHHLAFIRNNTIFNSYLDHSLYRTYTCGTTALRTSTNQFTIGGWSSLDTNYFPNCYLDEFRISTKARDISDLIYTRRK